MSRAAYRPPPGFVLTSSDHPGVDVYAPADDTSEPAPCAATAPATAPPRVELGWARVALPPMLIGACLGTPMLPLLGAGLLVWAIALLWLAVRAHRALR